MVVCSGLSGIVGTFSVCSSVCLGILRFSGFVLVECVGFCYCLSYLNQYT